MNNERISYTETEVEALTGLRVKTLQRWRLMNKGPRFVRAGRCVRYPSSFLNEWLNSLPSGGAPRQGVR
jgi:predicted DNA-binding transcriptional regulator AlpA